MTSTHPEKTEELYGWMAEFATPEALMAAAEKATQSGYHRMEAYSPFPIEGLSEVMGLRRSRMPLLVLIGGVLGALGGFFMQYYASVIAYPYNIGGRPFNSWPAFIPVTFELMILGAAFAAVFGMLALNGLPMPYHPVFNVKEFENVTKDRFFLFIRAIDPKFDHDKTREFLRSLNPDNLFPVEP